MTSSSSTLRDSAGVARARRRLTCVRNEPGADQLAHHDRQVGGDGHHAVLQVVVQLSAVVRDLDHLRGKNEGKSIYGGRFTGRRGRRLCDSSDEVVTEDPHGCIQVQATRVVIISSVERLRWRSGGGLKGRT